MSELLPLAEAAAFCAVPPARFLEMVSDGYYPPAIDRDPLAPEWYRAELLAVMQARDAARVKTMTAAGLLAECGDVPRGRRIEASTGSAKAAGELCLRLAVYGAQAYRAGARDFRVWIKSRRPAGVLHQLAAQFPALEFVEVRE